MLPYTYVLHQLNKLKMKEESRYVFTNIYNRRNSCGKLEQASQQQKEPRRNLEQGFHVCCEIKQPKSRQQHSNFL